MEKILYLTTWPFENEKNNGICKKINMQVKVMEENSFAVDLSYIKSGKTYLRKDHIEMNLGKNGKFGKIKAHYYLYRQLKKEEYNKVYIRYGMADPLFIQLLKLLKKSNDAKILVEIPSYPYDKECSKLFMDQVNFTIDRIYRKKMVKFVDRIVTFSDDKSIFGIKTIRISNGILVDNVRKRKVRQGKRDIHLIAVAQFAMWHGCDRLINGMAKYYQTEGRRKVYFHIVGGGKILEEYKKLVSQNDLENYVIFHGEQYGDELDNIYDLADIGVECLGLHRRGALMCSSLKAKEYAAKGLPILTSCEMDQFQDKEYNFIKRFPATEEDIDIDEIVKFSDEILGKDKEFAVSVSEMIRNFAKERCDIFRTFEPVLKFFT